MSDRPRQPISESPPSLRPTESPFFWLAIMVSASVGFIGVCWAVSLVFTP